MVAFVLLETIEEWMKLPARQRIMETLAGEGSGIWLDFMHARNRLLVQASFCLMVQRSDKIALVIIELDWRVLSGTAPSFHMAMRTSVRLKRMILVHSYHGGMALSLLSEIFEQHPAPKNDRPPAYSFISAKTMQRA